MRLIAISRGSFEWRGKDAQRLRVYLKLIRDSNDHGSSILDDVHSIWLKDGDQNEGVGSLEDLHTLADGFT